MLQSNKFKLEMSKSRERLAELTKKDDLTEGETTEMKSLTDGYDALETKYRASIVAEQAEEEEHKAETEPDGEQKELYEIEKQACLLDFIKDQTGDQKLDGASKEFAEAFKAQDKEIPFAVFAPKEDELEERQFADAVTATDGTTLTRPRSFLERIFAGEAASHLGIRPQAVPVGQEVYPVITAGASGGALPKGTERDSEAVTADLAKKLSPVRCAAQVKFHRQDAFRIPGWEEAIKRDLRESVMNTMHKEIINGADDSSNSSLIEGLLESQTPTLLKDNGTDAVQGTATTGAQVIAGFEGLVDGIYARSTSELRALMAPEARSYLGQIADASTNAPRNYILDQLRHVKEIPIMATDHISELGTTGDAAGDSYVIVSKQRGLMGSFALPVWENARILVDYWSESEFGLIKMVLEAYYNFLVIRDDNFAIRRIARS